MKTVLYMAISLNGYIAEKDGTEGFLSNKNWDTFCNLAKKYGNFVVGRKTYEAVKGWGEGFGFDDLKDIKKVIISQNKNYQLDNGYTLATSPEEALSHLQTFETVLITGGSTINTAFITANLVDEIVLNIEPTIIGGGIPLFAVSGFEQKLELLSSAQSENGILTVKYRIIK